ncbi:MAG: hypothetical protein ACKOEK_00245, partial [Actinomycetota bacterium]
DELGSIEVGKIANLTALDFDPYDVDPSRIGSIPIRTTMFEGRVFNVEPALVEQRSGLQARDTAPSNVIAGIPKDEAGCSCEVASFLAQLMRAEGWAA